MQQLIPTQAQFFPSQSRHTYPPKKCFKSHINRRTINPQQIKAQQEIQEQPMILPDEYDEDEIVDDEGPCDSFIDNEGNFIPVMCCDYGFRTGTMRVYSEKRGTIPKNLFAIGMENFKYEWLALRRSFREDEYSKISEASPEGNILSQIASKSGGAIVKLFAAIDRLFEKSSIFQKLAPRLDSDDNSNLNKSSDCQEILVKLKKLTLSNKAVWDRERKREQEGGGVESPLPIRIAYYSLCYMLDVLFNNRPIQRFWFLECVARMPYFSYITMLHLYESLGWWRAGADLRKIHFAEEWNELHHLQIMETLGGDRLWVDRFIAYHASIAYYWILVGFFVFSPELAYNFSELIEAHAVDTYGQFVDENQELLRSIPPPMVAAKYYRSQDLYMFDEFQTSRIREPRRPPCNNLYDTFVNIRDDEGEHVKTMKACQDTTIAEDIKFKEDLKEGYE
eukprot:TRINITY_DN7117_c0_g1_i13.p2 TRINITY_DN7117_c0_g1~~TRINITY_DN7117_c0_g1_i13.p2  ORF type:complete len:450 (+),score=69.27 TRINITY_DN7117_c0_g1_i13:187-1536(+)